MIKFIGILIGITTVGIFVVFGEVEALKAGYEIRSLNQEKLEIRKNVKELEYQIACRMAVPTLEEKLKSFDIALSQPKILRIARVDYGAVNQTLESRKPQKETLMAKIFLGTAQAEGQ